MFLAYLEANVIDKIQKLKNYNNQLIKLENFLNNQTPQLKDSIIDFLADIEIKTLVQLIDLIGSSNINNLISKVNENPILSNIYKFYNASIGDGELLCAWILNGKLTSNSAYDILLGDKLVEIKTPANNGDIFFYRFGMANDIVIQNISIEGINLWNEISYTLNKLNKLDIEELKKLYINETEENKRLVYEAIDYLLENISTIKNANITGITIYHLNNFYIVSKNLSIDKEDKTYSRVDLRGNYINRDKIDIEPIKREDIENAKQGNTKSQRTIKITIKDKSNKEDKVDNFLVGRLNDLYYVRHADKFEDHIKESAKAIIDDNKLYIFFDKNENIIFSGNGVKLKNRIGFHSISNSRFKVFVNNIDKVYDIFKQLYHEDAIGTAAFSTPSGAGGSPVESITPSNYVGTMGRKKKKKRKFIRIQRQKVINDFI